MTEKDEGYRLLAKAVIRFALLDLKHTERRLEIIQFFASEWGQTILRMAQIDNGLTDRIQLKKVA